MSRLSHQTVELTCNICLGNGIILHNNGEGVDETKCDYCRGIGTKIVYIKFARSGFSVINRS